jgi:hypothetical protein
MQQLTRGERKALAYHMAVADKLRADPGLRATARTRLQWYRERNPAGKVYYDRWEELLTGPLEELLALLVDPSANACSLRQENPFVDLISQSDRAAIYRAVVEQIDAGRA